MKQENSLAESLAVIHDRLLSAGATVSTAESCTSGRIAALLTSVSGASGYVEGGIVAYQDAVKVRELGVGAETIRQYDVVSAEVVTEMVQGACRRFGTTYALASTGYAEAWEGHDVHIWIGWGTATEVHTRCLTDDHGRNANVEQAANQAVISFAQWLEEAAPDGLLL